jgi:hypothetical protein
MSALLGIVGLCGGAYARTGDLPFVFLIQNSGWMEPFYTDDRAEKFDRIVAGFIERVTPRGAPIVIASFNHEGEIPGVSSPMIVFRGAATDDAVESAVAQVQLGYQPNRRLANSDYHEALVNTIRRILAAHPGVIFMVTNNKSAPVGTENIEDRQVTSRTESFNALVKNSSAISRVVAWPVSLKVHSRFDESGLVFYGIAYGEAASPLLKQRSELRDMQQWLGDPPVRLKPLTLEPLVLSLTPGAREEARWYADARGNVHVDGIASGGDLIHMTGALTNTHYPYVIRQAGIVASWVPAARAQASVQTFIDPSKISDLPPFATIGGVGLGLRVSSAERTRWLDDRAEVPGTLSIRLVGLKLGLSPAFARKMRDMFGNGAAPAPEVPDELPPQTPKIFLNYTNIDRAMMQIPLTLGIKFFPWPLILLIAGALAVLVPMIALVWFGTRERVFSVPLDGEARAVGLRPFQTKEIAGVRDTYRISRGLFGKPVVRAKGLQPAQ